MSQLNTMEINFEIESKPEKPGRAIIENKTQKGI